MDELADNDHGWYFCRRAVIEISKLFHAKVGSDNSLPALIPKQDKHYPVTTLEEVTILIT